jgi:tetrahydromethanopterin S-methyltransferase subunit H
MPVSSHGTNLIKKKDTKKKTKKCDVIHNNTDIICIYIDVILFKFLTKFLQLFPSLVIVSFILSNAAEYNYGTDFFCASCALFSHSAFL